MKVLIQQDLGRSKEDIFMIFRVDCFASVLLCSAAAFQKKDYNRKRPSGETLTKKTTVMNCRGGAKKATFICVFVCTLHCGSVDRVLDFKSGGTKFESHCSRCVPETLHPKVLLWGLSTVLNVCKSHTNGM